MGAAFTLGAEEELHLIDLDRWELSARAPQILSRLPSAFYSAEIQRTTVETNTAVVRTLTDLREELLRLRRRTSGSPPSARRRAPPTPTSSSRAPAGTAGCTSSTACSSTSS